MKTATGWHWILDAHDADPARLADADRLRRLLVEIPLRLGLTRVGEPALHHHAESAGAEGLAGVVLLAESHLSLHARPAHGALHADLYSCAPFEPAVARATLQAEYGFVRFTEQVLTRGVP